MTKVFTHTGTLRGDARTGGHQFTTRLRLTPSGSHWVDSRGRKYRRSGGGYVGDRWPPYFLDASSIREIAQGMSPEGRQQSAGPSGLTGPVPEGDAPKGDSE